MKLKTNSKYSDLVCLAPRQLFMVTKGDVVEPKIKVEVFRSQNLDFKTFLAFLRCKAR